MPDHIWRAWNTKPDPRVAELEAEVEQLETRIELLETLEADALTTAQQELAVMQRNWDAATRDLTAVRAENLANQRRHGEALQRVTALEAELARLKPIADRYAQEEADKQKILTEQARQPGTRFSLLEVD